MVDERVVWPKKKKTHPLPCPDFERKFARDMGLGWEGGLICKPIPSLTSTIYSYYISVNAMSI